MKKISRRLVMLIILSAMIIATAISVGVYALITSTSSRGNIDISTTEVTATTQYSSSTGSYSFTYEAAGDAKTITISTTNQSGVVLHNIYNVEATSGDDNLKKAILVYFNDEYIGTLAELTTVPLDIENKYSFIPLAESGTDTLKFELHQAAENSLFDGKTVTISITTITQNADYLDYIYVTNEETFSRAIDDVNSGLFSVNPTIVICNNVTLTNSYTIKNPTTIYLNGTLNGSLTINDDNTTSPDALLEILGNSSINGTITLGSYYDEDGAKSLVFNHIKDVIGEALSCGSTTNILGPYSFYGLNITVGSNCQYTSPNIIITNTSNEYYSKVASIVVEDETIEFKVLGSKSELIDATLAHLPNDGDIVSTDLFLPTYIKDQNATITWKSSDEDIISSQGKIAATRLENAEVSLLAEIKINDTVVTRTFDFKVSVHNNEINFYKLVQEISPIVIANVYNDASDADDALYHLPIVSQNSNGTFNEYDYRTSYDSPVNTQLFNWSAFKDIGIESITYSMTEEQIAAYDYITQSGNTLYLNTETLNSFARITITGDFGNDETYSTHINISISVGSNTQLLEKAFIQVSNELQEISVLGNIIATRISDGMGEEKGDFSLSATYKEDPEYTIVFSGANTIIDSITYDSVNDKYDFTINPEYFNEYETTVAFKATVYYKKGTIAETSKSRTFYVVVPAALHVDNFGTISLYESAKYQVFSQLPSNEKTGNTGYSTSDTILSDSNINYVLLRDIVGDVNYLTEYDTNDGYYLEVCGYTQASQYAQGVSILKFMTRSTNEQQTSDTAAYDLARLIEWATSDTRVAASTVVSNTQALGSLTSTKSNAEDYLNEDELAVIKQVYKYYTGASDSDWNNVYLESFNEAPGYIYTNPELLNQVIVSVSKSLSTYYNGGTATNFATIFGKYMEVIQRYAVSTTTVNKDDAAPCQEIYNTRYRWVESTSNLSSYTYNGTSYNINYSVQLNNGKWWCRYTFAGGSSGGDGNGSAKNYSLLASDRTSYITEDELTILRVFWLNGISASSGSTTGLNTSLTSNYSNINKVLQDDGGIYYYGFSLSNFNTAGKALLNAFDACLEIPTYFTADGVSLLIKEFYNNYNYGSKKYELNKYGENTTTFKTSLNSGIPYVTNVDSLKSALSYFTNLSTLEIYGNDNLAAFLSENGLSTLVARTSLVNKEISRLVMQNVAHTNTNFDLTNIKNYDKLTYLDLSNNLGIHSVNELVNVNRGNYTYVNITNIGVEYEYQEFAIDNIATSTCTIYYKNANGVNTYSNDSSRASDLADLSDFNKFISKYMYMTNVIYNEDGSTTTINWRIDEGNELYGRITNPGKYPEITSISEMNQMVSPFYYCSESFTYSYKNGTYSFIEGHIYKIGASGSTIVFNDLGLSSKTTTTSLPSVGFENVDVSDFEVKTTTETSYEEVEAGTTTNLETVTWYTENSTSVTITISAQYYYYNSSKKRYLSYRSFSGIPGLTQDTSTGTAGQYNRVYFLSEENVKNILNKSYKANTTITEDVYLNERYYLCFVYNNQLYLIGNKSDTIANDIIPSVTTNINSALSYTLVQYTSGYYYIQLYENTTFRLRCTDDFYVKYHSNKDAKGRWTVSTGVSTTINYTINPNFVVTYKDNSTDTIEAYKVGYEVDKIEGAILEYTDLKSIVSETRTTSYKYYFYTGENTIINNVTLKTNTIIAVFSSYDYVDNSIERKYTSSNSIIYVINIWYNETSSSDKVYLSNPLNIKSITINTLNSTQTYLISDIRSRFPADTEGTNSEYTYVYNDVEYTINDEGYSDMAYLYEHLTSNWELSSTVVIPYATYTTDLTSANTDLLNKQVEFYYGLSSGYEYIFRYTGETVTDNIYSWSPLYIQTIYSKNHAYNLTVNDGVLEWEHYAESVADSGGTNMDSILTEANSHFKDYLYGSYYGRYYAYSGTARYISSGIYVRPGYIYRIMPNAKNTAFEWVEVKAYTEDTSDNILIALGTGQLSVGDIVRSTAQAGFGFFNAGWYKVTLDEKTNIVNLVKYNDMGITINGESTYTSLTNDKLVQRTGDYLGYSGTFTVQITALIRTVQTDGTVLEYKKIYKMKFVGSLYE